MPSASVWGTALTKTPQRVITIRDLEANTCSLNNVFWTNKTSSPHWAGAKPRQAVCVWSRTRTRQPALASWFPCPRPAACSREQLSSSQFKLRKKSQRISWLLHRLRKRTSSLLSSKKAAIMWMILRPWNTAMIICKYCSPYNLVNLGAQDQWGRNRLQRLTFRIWKSNWKTRETDALAWSRRSSKCKELTKKWSRSRASEIAISDMNIGCYFTI